MDTHTIQAKLDYRADQELKQRIEDAFAPMRQYNEGWYEMKFRVSEDPNEKPLNAWGVVGFLQERAFQNYRQQNRDQVTNDFLKSVNELKVQLDSLDDPS